MSRKDASNGKPAGNSPGKGVRQWGGNKLKFISPSLTAVDKKWLGDRILDAHVLVAEFLTNLPETVQLSSKYDQHTDMWMATAIGVGDDHAYSGLALVCRNRDRFLAVYGLAYLHDIKLERIWAEPSTEDADGWG